MASDHPGTPANLESLLQSILPALEFKEFTPGELRKLIMDVYFTTSRIKQTLATLEEAGELTRAGRYRFQLGPTEATGSAHVMPADNGLTLVLETNAPGAVPQAAPAPAPQAAPAAVGRLSTLGGYIMEVVCTAPGVPFPNSVVTQNINATHLTNYNDPIVLFTAKVELVPKGLVVVVESGVPEPTITGIRCV